MYQCVVSSTIKSDVFSTSLTTLLPLLPFAGRNSNRFGMAFIVILICIFLMINDGGNFLHFFLHCPQSSACLLLRYICSGPLPFLIGLSSLMLWNRSSSSCILDINPLSYRWIANIFSQATGCLSTLAIVPCAAERLWSSMPFYLSISAFVTSAFRVASETLRPNVKKLPLFTFRTFKVVGIPLVFKLI